MNGNWGTAAPAIHEMDTTARLRARWAPVLRLERDGTVRHEFSIIIDQPPEAVFRYVCDDATLAQWQRRIVDVQKEDEKSLRKGSKLSVVLREPLGGQRPVRMQINDYGKYERLEYEMKGPGFLMDGRYIFEQEGSSTFIIYTTVRHVREWRYRLLWPLYKAALGRMIRGDLQRLKETLEKNGD